MAELLLRRIGRDRICILGGGSRVEVAWVVEHDAGTAGPRLRLRWTETGGAPMTPPSRTGSRLIRGSLGRQRRAEVRTDSAPEGVRFTMAMPMDTGQAKPSTQPA